MRRFRFFRRKEKSCDVINAPASKNHIRGQRKKKSGISARLGKVEEGDK